jgi:predicted amidohydrolase
MKKKFIASVVQIGSKQNPAENLEKVIHFIRKAHTEGAQWVGLPENFYSPRPEGKKSPVRCSLDGEPIQTLQKLAKELKIYLLCGTIPEKATGGRVWNTSVFLGPRGEIVAVYRKIHLFDVFLASGALYRESRYVAPGRKIVLGKTPWGKMGMSICYDLRFPELYRKMIDRGAFAFTIPSAFAFETGKEHWITLLRARAIENLAYVFAPAQVGYHTPKRRSFGHACIIDPWGSVLGILSKGEGTLTAEIDLQKQQDLRSRFPALHHRVIKS